jgi:hypothetical protein
MLRLFPVVGLLIMVALPAEASSLCGQQFGNRTALESSLRIAPGVRSSAVAAGIKTVFGPNRTLWWFTQAAHSAFPAVVCQEQLEQHGGYVRLPVQSDCGNASKKACRALARDLAKVKF